MPRKLDSRATTKYDATVSVLTMLAKKHTNMPVPRVLNSGVMDGLPWMLLNLMPGDDMCRSLYDQLSSQHACSIAKQVAHVLHSLYKTCFFGCGSLIKGSEGLTIGRPVVDASRESTSFRHVFDPNYLAPPTLRDFLRHRFDIMLADATSNIEVFVFLFATRAFF